jgi:hypothetical protein
MSGTASAAAAPQPALAGGIPTPAARLGTADLHRPASRHGGGFAVARARPEALAARPLHPWHSRNEVGA